MADEETKQPAETTESLESAESDTSDKSVFSRPELPKRSWRRRFAFPILVLAIAGLAAFWSRNRPVSVEVTYDLGPNAARVSRITLSYQQDGKNVQQPVEWTFPGGAPVKRKHRHTLKLKPGSYTVRARMHLRAQGSRGAEVRKLTRRFKLDSGDDQHITLRFR